MEKEREVERRVEAPLGRDDVHVAGNRCPYCHDDVARETADVCRDCLARHHPACWAEAPRCGACGCTEALRSAQVPPAAARCRRRCDHPRLPDGELCERHALQERVFHRFMGRLLVAFALVGVICGVVLLDVGLLALFGLMGGGGALVLWQHRRLPPLPPA